MIYHAINNANNNTVFLDIYIVHKFVSGNKMRDKLRKMLKVKADIAYEVSFR